MGRRALEKEHVWNQESMGISLLFRKHAILRRLAPDMLELIRATEYYNIINNHEISRESKNSIYMFY